MAAPLARRRTQGCVNIAQMSRTGSGSAEAIPTWSTWRQACRVVVYRAHLRATTRIALVVGTVLFAINQLDVVLAGEATTTTWVKSVVTYGVPFVVSNLGILTATRRRP
jgi:hypothetical protein